MILIDCRPPSAANAWSRIVKRLSQAYVASGIVIHGQLPVNA
jgi:hypothetical protein